MIDTKKDIACEQVLRDEIAKIIAGIEVDV